MLLARGPLGAAARLPRLAVHAVAAVTVGARAPRRAAPGRRHGHARVRHLLALRLVRDGLPEAVDLLRAVFAARRHRERGVVQRRERLPPPAEVVLVQVRLQLLLRLAVVVVVELAVVVGGPQRVARVRPQAPLGRHGRGRGGRGRRRHGGRHRGRRAAQRRGGRQRPEDALDGRHAVRVLGALRRRRRAGLQAHLRAGIRQAGRRGRARRVGDVFLLLLLVFVVLVFLGHGPLAAVVRLSGNSDGAGGGDWHLHGDGRQFATLEAAVLAGREALLLERMLGGRGSSGADGIANFRGVPAVRCSRGCRCRYDRAIVGVLQVAVVQVDVLAWCQDLLVEKPIPVVLQVAADRVVLITVLGGGQELHLQRHVAGVRAEQRHGLLVAGLPQVDPVHGQDGVPDVELLGASRRAVRLQLRYEDGHAVLAPARHRHAEALARLPRHRHRSDDGLVPQRGRRVRLGAGRRRRRRGGGRRLVAVAVHDGRVDVVYVVNGVVVVVVAVVVVDPLLLLVRRVDAARADHRLVALQQDLGLELAPQLVANVRLHVAAEQLQLLDAPGQLLVQVLGGEPRARHLALQRHQRVAQRRVLPLQLLPLGVQRGHGVPRHFDVVPRGPVQLPLQLPLQPAQDALVLLLLLVRLLERLLELRGVELQQEHVQLVLQRLPRRPGLHQLGTHVHQLCLNFCTVLEDSLSLVRKLCKT